MEHFSMSKDCATFLWREIVSIIKHKDITEYTYNSLVNLAEALANDNEITFTID